MKLLGEIRDSDIFPNAKDADTTGFKERRAVRIILRNEMGQVALLRVGLHNYHKLPGGGIEGDETALQALRRETLEEVGCDVEVAAEDEIGRIIEYKSEKEKKQISTAYLGRQVGELQPPTLTEKELAEQCEPVWVDDIDSAISILESDIPVDYTGHFIQRRDITFLEAARSLIARQG